MYEWRLPFDSLVLQKVQFDRQPSEIWVIEIKLFNGILGRRIFSSFSLLWLIVLSELFRIERVDSLSWMVLTMDFRCLVPKRRALGFSCFMFLESVSGMQPVIIVSCLVLD